MNKEYIISGDLSGDKNIIIEARLNGVNMGKTILTVDEVKALIKHFI